MRVLACLCGPGGSLGAGALTALRRSCACVGGGATFLGCRFELDDWQPGKENLKDPNLWDQAWDDDGVDDPVGQQIREAAQQLQQQQQQQEAAAQGKQ